MSDLFDEVNKIVSEASVDSEHFIDHVRELVDNHTIFVVAHSDDGNFVMFTNKNTKHDELVFMLEAAKVHILMEPYLSDGGETTP